MHLRAVFWLAALVAASPLAASTSTSTTDSPPAVTRKAAVSGGEKIRSVVEIIAIDPAARLVTLRRDDGNNLTVTAGPKVRNFSQIAVGDFVIAEYGRAQAISISPAPPPGTREQEGQKQATGAKGRTAKQATQRKTIVGDIMAIDDKRGQATLKGDKGQIVDVSVQDRKALAAVKIGDQVTLEYTEAVASSLTPARTRERRTAP